MRAVPVPARWTALTVIAVVPVLLATALVWTGLRAVAAVIAPGPADPADALVALAASACVLLLLWLAGSVLTVAAVTALDARGRRCSTARRMLSLLAPVTVQRLVAALIGAGVVTGLATPALASDAVPRVSAPHAMASTSPQPDPQSPTKTETTPTGTTPTTPELDPGWVPATTPSAPLSPCGAENSATLLTTSPRAGSQPLDEVVVRRGDTLWDLAARHLGSDATDAEIATEWQRWYAANRALVGSDPDHILPGQRLAPPALTNP